MTSIRIGPDEGARIPRGARYHRALAELPELEVIDGRFGPAFGVDPRTHRDHVDSFYVLEGVAERTRRGDRVRDGPGPQTALPAGLVPNFWEPNRRHGLTHNSHAP